MLMFRYAGGYLVGKMGQVTAFTFENLGLRLGVETVQSLWIFYLSQLFLILAPVLAGILVVSLLVNYMQVGVLFTVKPLTPKFSNLNPAEGFKKLFSQRTLVEGLKTVLKISLVSYMAYATIKSSLPDLIPAMDMANADSLQFIGSLTMKVMTRILGVLFILAILDLAYQRWFFHDSLKMTRQEVRDELRQSEGDPLIKARIRQIQREMARRRMFEAVPRADVVVTNPTHVAVALEYKENMRAPKVVAKGERVVAERIKEQARLHNIPVVENPPLARALFKSCPVGADIPGDLYETVAEVLAFVFRVNNAKGAA
jgi:flagellar biosynthetic protein FlhB